MAINPLDLLKNFQNIQSKMSEMQERLKDIVVTGSAGGGMVRIDIDGQLAVRSVEISPEAADYVNSVILDQVTNGVALRMALLYLLAGGMRNADDH